MSLPVPNTIATVSARVAEHRLQWDVVATLLGGTSEMRRAGKTYLPIEPNEELEDWQARLDRTTLDNFFADGVARLVSKVFAKELKFDKVPQKLALLLEDFDNQQQNATQVALRVFKDAATYGIGYMLTEYPSLPDGFQFQNYAQEQASGRRPYVVRVDPRSLLDVRSISFNGVERLGLFRWQEVDSVLAADGISEINTVQIRELKQVANEDGTPGAVTYTVYRKHDLHTEWYVHKTGTLPVTAIPVAPDYGNRSGFMLGLPPLFDLAQQNLLHWRLSSDLNNILHICNVPFLFAKGFKQQTDKDGNDVSFAISVRKALTTSNEAADVKWVEHQGNSIVAAMNHIANLEKRMEARAMAVLAQTGGTVTATATAINAAEANAGLKQMALSLQDSLNATLYFMSLYLGLPSYGKVEVNTSFSNDYVSETTFEQVLALFAAGLITQEVVISEAKRRNIIDQNQVIVPVKQTVTSVEPQVEAGEQEQKELVPAE